MFNTLHSLNVMYINYQMYNMYLFLKFIINKIKIKIVFYIQLYRSQMTGYATKREI